MALIIENVNIIPMTEKKVLYGHDMLIEDGKIKIIDTNINIENIDRINCEGKFIIPGLFDMHLHLISDTYSKIGLLIANGVTGVRNMWGSYEILALKEAIKSGKVIGPDIYSTGPLTDGKNAWDGCAVVTNAIDAERAVLNVVEEGYDYVKTYPDIPREPFIKLMKTAQGHGIHVVGHGNNNVTAEELISLGYYSIEHSSCLPKDEEDIIKIAKSGMWFTPTHITLKEVVNYVHNNIDVSSFAHMEYVSKKLRDEWEGVITLFRGRPRFQQFTMENFIKASKTFIKYSDNILLGSDMANPGVVAGFSLHDELKLMVDYVGLDTFQALLTGTVNAAKSLGIYDKAGTIENGKTADLLVLDDNPLEDISNTQKIFAVVKSGRLYDRMQLDHILETSRQLVQS